MKSELQIFQYEDNDVRTVFIDGAPWWVAKDVCEVFGETNRNRAMQALDDDEKGYTQIDTPGGLQQISIVNEAGLYALLFAMQPTKARSTSVEYINEREAKLKNFKRWVTHEVLPTIRKTGGYVSNEETFIETYLPNADEPTKQLFKLNLEVIRQLNTKIDHMKPLAEFAEHVSKSSDTIEVGQLAKIAYDENIKLGRNKLFDWLRSKGYLRKNNEPYQEYIDKGLFKLKEQNFVTPYGPKISMKTLVTGRGQMEIIEHLRTEFQ